MVLSACASEPLPPGELTLIFTGPDGARREGSTGEYYLGHVFACGGAPPVEAKIVVKNVGEGPLTLSRLEWAEGDAVRIGGAGPEAARWDVAFTSGQSLEAQEFVEIEFSFTPSGGWPVGGPYGSTTTLVLHSDDAAPDANWAEITLTVGAVTGLCEMVTGVDFGGVVVGSTYRRSIELWNPTQWPMRALVGEIEGCGGDQTAFSFVPGTPRGEFDVPSGSTATIEIDFQPTIEKPYAATVVTKASDCCEATVRLTGTGVPSILTWAPEEVDCGESTVGVEVLRPLTVTNHAHFDVALWNLQTVGHSGFRVLPPAGSSPEVVLVPGSGGTATLTVGCTPKVEGLREAALSIPTNSPEMPWLEIPVRVTGLAL